MKNTIRVLHLEDNPTDAELIYANLESSGFVCDVQRVDNEADFIDALEKNDFDLVISDFSMPGYNGSEALKYVHRAHPEIPFIFVSGTLGEDFAIESLLNGATDYVLKTKMARLVPAVVRAIEEKRERARRRDAEKALRERDERFHALLENSMDGMVVFDREGEVVLRSPANVRLLGQETYRPDGGSIFDGMHPDDVPAIRSEIARLAQIYRSKGTVTFRYRHGDGSWRWLEATFSNLLHDPTVKGIVSNFRDVSDRLEAEALLRQAQKMQSLGTLAGGIAHDFNNILGIILGYASFINKRNLDEGKMSQSIGAIQNAAERGVGLVRQLLMFARKQESEFLPISVNDVVKEVFSLVSETFPKVISAEMETDPSVPPVVGDHIQINQCILNLCVNARDAMMDRKDGKPPGGVLKVRTGIAGEHLFKDAVHPQYVAISVGDTGIGMDEATRARIFEPFFTTKEKGKGTGIGLATVFGVMKKHGGFIDVSTELGAGTTFTLCFPAAGSGNEKAVAGEVEVSANMRGDETVLVVEDEETLRELLKDALTDNGYRVYAAENGAEALSTLSRAGKVALVICDLGLPELDGLEVLARIKRNNPKVKAVLASGFLEYEQRRKMESSHVEGFIQKPYRVSEVLKKIREILDAGAKPSKTQR